MTIFKRKKHICRRLFTSSKKTSHNEISHPCRAETAMKRCTKTPDTRAELLLVFRCGSRRVTKFLYITVRVTAIDN